MSGIIFPLFVKKKTSPDMLDMHAKFSLESLEEFTSSCKKNIHKTEAMNHIFGERGRQREES